MTLTTPSQSATAFRRLRRRLLVNNLRSVREGSRLRLLMIVVCSALFWTGLFGLFFEGFQFIDSYVKLSNEIVEYIFGMFFLSLLIMLVFSTGIILHTEPVLLARINLPADDPRRHRPDLRLQVRRGDGLL